MPPFITADIGHQSQKIIFKNPSKGKWRGVRPEPSQSKRLLFSCFDVGH